MAGEVSIEVARGLVATGLSPGKVETEFGECVIAKSMYKAAVIFTLTFTLVKEKWAVINGQLVKAEYKEPDWISAPITSPEGAQASMETQQKGMSNVRETGVHTIEQPLIPDEVEEGPKKRHPSKSQVGVDLPNSRKKEVKKTMTEIKPSRKVRTIPELPKGAKRIKERVAPIPKGKVKHDMGKKGHPTKVTMPVPKKQAPRVTPKVGPKPPRWVTQIGWDGKKEKVDTNLYPVPIKCVKCKQVRWIDKRNAGNQSHPVTMCKPCSRKDKQQKHDQRIKDKRALTREAAAETARWKKASKQIRKAVKAKAPSKKPVTRNR